MQLPKDLLSGNYTRPRLFLCETDKSIICQLDPHEMNGVFKFNSYSELEFSIGRTYEDMITGEMKVNPYYNKIEALRLVYLEGFGYFEIQDPEIVSDGIMEVKNITANSLEYNLSQKYLENFYINTGETKSIEYIYADDNNRYDSDGAILITPVSFYNPETPGLSLLHLILSKAYGWTIGHVDASLQTMTRSFEVSRSSVYDFIMQDICEKFNCFTVFDTVNNTINFYAETLITKFIGDGSRTSFTISPPYQTIGSVSIEGYKTSKYIYDATTGKLDLNDAPADGAIIEITDGSQKKWITDVYVTFDNLAQEVNISYSADDIKTVLTVRGADDLSIREVNMGLPYITDLSYYYTVEWMGQDLYDAYTKYIHKCNGSQEKYTENAREQQEISNYITYEQTRLSLEYALASHVNSETVGKYYVRGGTAPNYYYIEVQLPSEYSTSVKNYYSLAGTSINETKVRNLYNALIDYYSLGESSSISKLSGDFAFMTYTIELLVYDLSNASTISAKDTAVNKFLDEMWNQLGLTPLNTLYYSDYKLIKQTNTEAGWNNPSNENYWKYYPVTLMLDSLDRAMAERDKTIAAYEAEYKTYVDANEKITNSLLMENNFTHAQRIRLSPFLREDEYSDDNFVITEADSNETILKTEQELLECGKIELAKLCEPKLEFSMDMANIYALKEFEPIVNQFQLGNLINVVLRDDYIKRARLLEVNINFDDFSDFSCAFGELTNRQTPSSIHADLLSQALTAGKSVASNASYWNKGADLATQTDLKIQQGLLDATNGLYSSNQGVIIDKTGIRLTKIINESTGEVSPKQAWIVNNNILFSSDGFQTSEVGLGEFKIGDESFYGLLAQAVLSGYIESSTIVGGVIKIGERSDGTYNFEVDENGIVTIRGGEGIAGEMTAMQTQINNLQNGQTSVGPTPPESPTNGQLWVDTSVESQSVMKMWNEETQQWEIVDTDTTSTIFTKKPETVLANGLCYKENDLWIVGEDYQPEGYSIQTLLVCINSNTVYSDDDWVDSEIYNQRITNLEDRTSIIEEHVEIADDGLYLKGLASDGTYPFYSRLSSTELSFCEQSPGQLRDAERDKVVWIGNNEMHAKETTIENSLKIEASDSDQYPCLQIGDFKLQIEENGSFSITK